VLFDKIASAYFIWKISLYWYSSIGNGQPSEPALCQLYRHSFVPYTEENCIGRRTVRPKRTLVSQAFCQLCDCCYPCCGTHTRAMLGNALDQWFNHLGADKTYERDMSTPLSSLTLRRSTASFAFFIFYHPLFHHPHSFIPGLKPSFSANPSHSSLPFLLQDWLHGFTGLFTDTSEHIRFLLFSFFLFCTF